MLPQPWASRYSTIFLIDLDRAWNTTEYRASDRAGGRHDSDLHRYRQTQSRTQGVRHHFRHPLKMEGSRPGKKVFKGWEPTTRPLQSIWKHG